MKLPFTIHDSRFTIWKKSSPTAVAAGRAYVPVNRKSSIVNRQSRRGIALVITLILLSVTLVMAVAFLAISNRERSSVTTTTDSTTARLAAETALAQAESQILATMLATTNPFNYGLVVSTNYVSGAGYDTSVGANPTNVNYDYLSTGGALSAAQLQQNIANLYLSPRVPVYIVTNQSAAADFRFYLDLNRNGRFDTNGVVPDVDNNLNPVGTGTTTLVGDPEWVGVLERPDTTHGPNNKFLSRYAFVAVPVGNTLDINYIHNQAKTMTVNPAAGGFDGFFRNEGVGSWEINLAAFLTDLNTNQWDPPTFWNVANDPYIYGRTNNNNNHGRGFEDALSILSYRYNGSYSTLAIPSANAYSALVNAGLDNYTFGNLMANTQLPVVNVPFNPAYWVGSDNVNHFFTPSEFFNPNETSTLFTNSLLNAGNGNSTYDRYTFYRMLSQLGTDSSPESGLINLNYDNLTPTNGFASVTNLIPWTAIGFFTNAADRMLRLYTTNWFQTDPSNYLATYYGITYTSPLGFNQFGEVTNLINSPYSGMTNQIPAFGIINIPVLMYGQFVYSPAVQRVLQLAANIYDATTNSTFAGKDFPSIFRPTFWVTNEFSYKNVYINGYEYVGPVSGIADSRLTVPVDVTDLSLGSSVANYPNGVNVYGVPWIIGAKKGFPNFNEFSMESVLQVTRKLQLFRTTNVTQRAIGGITAQLTATNQMYVFSVTNSLGIEFWNSYTNGYSNTVQVVVRDNLWMNLTNNGSLNILSNNFISIFTNVSLWPGSIWAGNALDTRFPSPFIVPLVTNLVFLPNSDYVSGLQKFIPNDPTPSPDWDTNVSVLPQFGLVMTNRLQVFMLDATGDHIIDYVQLSGPNSSRNINAELADPISTGVPAYLWSTNLFTNSFSPYGVINQISISSGSVAVGLIPSQDGGKWTSPSGFPNSIAADQTTEAAFFQGFLAANSLYRINGVTYTNTSLATQAPFTPTRVMVQYTSWQANDPLVHYIASDLNFSGVEQPSGLSTGVTKHDSTPAALLPDLSSVNMRYEPWGTLSYMASLANVDQNAFNLSYKDPLMSQSDLWDFPTGKLPAVGWLGRIHRGTPWQTIFLKATNIVDYTNGSTNGLNTWADWNGNTNAFDARNSRPTQDHLLFDVFTTAPNDNATRGQLSVNVGAVAGGRSLAAWSALFSGMVVLTNASLTLSNSWMVIDPAGLNGTNSAVGQLAVAINHTRTNALIFPMQAFTHKGDILATPQLTEQSPFLNLGNTNYISDEMYEWLPQQMMSLLRAPSAPRYVIYCYGQALKPAPNSIVTGGTFFQMCTNYQVVTESAARAVIRVDDAKTSHPHIVVESFNLLPPD